MDTITIRIVKGSPRQQFYINLLTPMQRTIMLAEAGRNHAIDMETAKEAEELAISPIRISFGMENYGLNDSNVNMVASNDNFAEVLEARLLARYPQAIFSIHITQSQDTLDIASYPDAETDSDAFVAVVDQEINDIFNAPEVMQTIAVYYREV